MLTLDQIVKLMDEVAERGLGRLEIERAGFRLRIDGAHPAPRLVEMNPAMAAPAATPALAVPPATAEAAGTTKVSDDVHVVKSPIVGTFYAAPAPDAPPFVGEGDKVAKGQIICIVEAMKLMNEIEADASGEVVEVYAKDGEPVEFGAPLIGIKKA